ncbi:hypothetical protein AXG93_1384s1020 [Marchantia polymorpha subsp. ruderalis]|uniref:Uncharacterized protein n=1 Tax=Marchantia polymorpha subsp. ruderalis TaxID=1480154 RepID=A0A176VT04_MARPO|nr:hypothetical protein AXG93_1384s1020 [Marchantia polymorpha subsp. ruderalis]
MKRQKVAEASEEDRRPEAQMAGTDIEEPLEKDVEPSGERTATLSQGLWPSERKQPSLEKNEFPNKADVLGPKTSEEHAKELTLSEEIPEHVVEQIDKTVVESFEIPSSQVSLEVVRLKSGKDLRSMNQRSWWSHF